MLIQESESLMLSVLILTLNEEANIGPCLDSVAFSDDIVLLDSGSNDRTAELAMARGARVVFRAMDDWASQLGFAVSQIPFRHPFVLMLDADERATPELAAALAQALRERQDAAAFSLRRRDWFLGRELRRTPAMSRYIRVFRPERVRFTRLVHPETHVDGTLAHLDARIEHYPFSKGIGQWVERHAAYADLEAREIHAALPPVSPALALFASCPFERQRRRKALLYRLPLRPLMRFLYLYLARGGFLDGRAGLCYAALQGFYELMVVLRAREIGPHPSPLAGRTAPAGARDAAPDLMEVDPGHPEHSSRSLSDVHDAASDRRTEPAVAAVASRGLAAARRAVAALLACGVLAVGAGLAAPRPAQAQLSLWGDALLDHGRRDAATRETVNTPTRSGASSLALYGLGAGLGLGLIDVRSATSSVVSTAATAGANEQGHGHGHGD